MTPEGWAHMATACPGASKVREKPPPGSLQTCHLVLCTQCVDGEHFPVPPHCTQPTGSQLTQEPLCTDSLSCVSSIIRAQRPEGGTEITRAFLMRNLVSERGNNLVKASQWQSWDWTLSCDSYPNPSSPLPQGCMTGLVPVQPPLAASRRMQESRASSLPGLCHMLEPGPNWETACWQRRSLCLFLETLGHPPTPHTQPLVFSPA